LSVIGFWDEGMQKTLLPTEGIRKKYRTYAPKNWSIKSSTKLLFSRVQRTPSRTGKEMKSGRKAEKITFFAGRVRWASGQKTFPGQ